MGFRTACTAAVVCFAAHPVALWTACLADKRKRMAEKMNAQQWRRLVGLLVEAGTGVSTENARLLLLQAADSGPLKLSVQGKKCNVAVVLVGEPFCALCVACCFVALSLELL